MRNLLLFITLLSGTLAFGQQYPFYKYYKFDPKTERIEREPTDQIYYYNKYLLTIEYEFDEYYGSFFKYHTEHYRVKLNTDAAIEEFNKVYISMEDVVDVEQVHARVIKEDKILDVDIEMEEFYSEDEDEQYNYFPITGLELGDEVEIMYTLKMSAFFNGDQFYFQGEVPIYNFDFRFIAPNDSYFNFLAHNGLPQPVMVDTILQRHQYDIHLDTIPAFKVEYFSEYSNVTMKLDASLKGVDGGFDSEYSPYTVFVEYANEIFNEPYSGKDMKSLKKLNERLGISRLNPQRENIRKIENYMKNEFLIGYGQPGMSVTEMIKSGKGDGTGALKLFMGLLNQANIPFEYGLVSDRYDTFFSDEIESDYFLQNYFIFFPEAKTYLAPLDFSSRLGYLDYSWVPNNGLFLESKQYPFRKTEYKVKPLKATKSHENTDSTIIEINVNADLTDAKITVERHLTGYDAGEHQVLYYLYPDTKKKETHDDLLNFFNDNSSFKMTSIENVGPEDAFVNPLIIKGEVTSLYVPLLEKAGERTIFRLGEIFGEYINPQDLEKKKSDFVFGHAFSRTITVIVNFPKAVKVSNTQVVEQFDKLSNLESTHISSKLTITDQQIVFKQRDEYKSHRYSIEDKEELMKIFNFHSDLRKINLIID